VLIVFYPRGWDVLSSCDENQVLWSVKFGALLDLSFVYPPKSDDDRCDMLALVARRDGDIRRAFVAAKDYPCFGEFLSDYGCDRVYKFTLTLCDSDGVRPDAVLRDTIVRVVCASISADYYGDDEAALPF
jgi:hypothetical protein